MPHHQADPARHPAEQKRIDEQQAHASLLLALASRQAATGHNEKTRRYVTQALAALDLADRLRRVPPPGIWPGPGSVPTEPIYRPRK